MYNDRSVLVIQVAAHQTHEPNEFLRVVWYSPGGPCCVLEVGQSTALSSLKVKGLTCSALLSFGRRREVQRSREAYTPEKYPFTITT